MRCVITFYLLFFILIGCASQDDSQIRISAFTVFNEADYVADLDTLTKYLIDRHPQVFTHITELEFNQLSTALQSKITDSTSLGEFLWMGRELIGAIGCGHTTLPTLGTRVSLPNAYHFPLQILYQDTQLIVVDTGPNSDKCRAGDEITHINGYPVGEIKRRLARHISSDAFNPSLIEYQINYDFGHYLPFELGFPENYTIYLKGKKGLVTLSALDTTYSEHSPPLMDCLSPLCFEIDSSKQIGILTIRSFHYYREHLQTFKNFIDRSMDKIKRSQIQKVLIDLRNNGGGDPYAAAHLFRYLIDEPRPYYAKENPGYQDLKKPLPPHKNRLETKPYFLINGKGFSSTGQFCALIKEHNLGIFLGETLGATYTCNAAVQPFILPHTHLTTYIATQTFSSAVMRPIAKGLIHPVHRITFELEDWISREDGQLERALIWMDGQ